MTILNQKAPLKSIIIATIVAISIFIAIMLAITLPLSATERAEQRLRSMLADEYPNIDKVEYFEELDGLKGKYKDYIVYDDKGQEIGLVAIDSSSEDILSITHNNVNYGEPILSLEDARSVAKDYLAKWGRELSGDYEAVVEEMAPLYSDIGGKHAYVYNLQWVRCVNGVTVDQDFCIFRIDANNGEVLYCSLPPVKPVDSKEISTYQPIISDQEALDIVGDYYPNPETWYNNSSFKESDEYRFEDVDIKVDRKCEKAFSRSDGEGHLIWRINILYEAHPKNVESSDENRIDYKGWTFEVDALSGKILSTDQTQ